jgi:flagellar hook-basal body complex protein FliE
MVANVLDALSAYRKTTALPQELNANASSAVTAGGQSFGDVLQDFVGDAVGKLKTAEDTTKLGVIGKAGPVQLATAVADAETMLQMMTSLRDKMIAAYQEVSRMGV